MGEIRAKKISQPVVSHPHHRANCWIFAEFGGIRYLNRLFVDVLNP